MDTQHIEFPSQKKSTAEKTTAWAKKCIDGAEKLAMYSNESIRATMDNKQINYDLYADKLDETDIQRVLNPYKLSGVDQSTAPAKMQNYPVSNPKVELLLGEESKRRLEYKVLAVNSDAISEKEKTTREQIIQLLIEKVQAKQYDEEQTKKEIEDLAKWRQYSVQDIRERMATHVLEYYTRKLRISDKFTSGFLDALLAAEELYCVDILSGEPIVRKVNPKGLYTVRSGDSPFIEDSDIIVEENYFPLGKVIDMYYEDLTSTQIKTLESRGQTQSSGNKLLNYSQNVAIPIPSMMFSEELDGFLIEIGPESSDYHSPYSPDGDVRVLRVVWKSMRKVGIMTYQEEDSVFKKIVDENFEPDIERGEEVKWVWISEWWEGTKLGADIYIKIQPRPIQFRSMTNISNCGSGYIGTIYNAVNSEGRSLMDRMKPYQYLYNVFMYRTELAFAKAKGRIGKMNLAKVPDGWDIDKWLYYAEQMGWAVEDPFKAATEGVATGKLAGNMNESSPSIDLEMGSYIQQHIQMLGFIENQLGQIAGITRQREGSIDNRETVGGVERAVMQSAAITEPWFRVHDATKLRVLETLLETAKYTLRNDKRMMQYVLDDLSEVVFEVDGELLNEAEYGLFMTDASADKELFTALKQLAQAAMQNDKVTLSGIVDIYTTQSISSLGAKLRTMEEEYNQRMQQAQQANNDALLEKVEMEKAAEMERLVMQHEHEYSLKLLDLEMASMRNLETGDEGAIEDLRLKREKMQKDYETKMKQLQETIRSNKENESIKREGLKVQARRASTTSKTSK